MFENLKLQCKQRLKIEDYKDVVMGYIASHEQHTNLYVTRVLLSLSLSVSVSLARFVVANNHKLPVQCIGSG
jgi:hypothetical protein